MFFHTDGGKIFQKSHWFSGNALYDVLLTNPVQSLWLSFRLPNWKFWLHLLCMKYFVSSSEWCFFSLCSIPDRYRNYYWQVCHNQSFGNVLFVSVSFFKPKFKVSMKDTKKVFLLSMKSLNLSKTRLMTSYRPYSRYHCDPLCAYLPGSYGFIHRS